MPSTPNSSRAGCGRARSRSTARRSTRLLRLAATSSPGTAASSVRSVSTSSSRSSRSSCEDRGRRRAARCDDGRRPRGAFLLHDLFGPAPARRADLIRYIRHPPLERAERRVGHDHCGHRRRRDHVRVADGVAEQCHLAEEVARSEISDVLVSAYDLGGSILDDEELVAETSRAHEPLARLDVDLVSLTSDLRQLSLRQTLEQRESLQMLHVHYW